MSYDVSIGDFHGNYTSNMGEFFRDHIGGDGIYELDGKTGREALYLLSRAFENINNNRSNETALRMDYDAPNGWGSILGATVFLAQIQSACASYPYDNVRVYG